MLSSRLIRLAGPAGLYALARRLSRGHPRILMYHRFAQTPMAGFVSTGTFDRQVREIARRYAPMTLGELIAALHGGRPVPRNAVVVTVDDGYADFHEVAWPVLRRHGVPATLFVTTGFVDRSLWLWPDQVAWLLETGRAPTGTITLGDHAVSFTDSARDNWRVLIDLMLTVPDREKHALIRDLAGKLDVELPTAAPQGYHSVTWDQLRHMQAEGLEIGGHSHTHPTLPRVSEPELADEIDACRVRLDAELGERPRPFCYPNGQPADLSRTVRDRVEAAGFTGAVVAFADGSEHADLFALRRHSASANGFQFDKAVSGLEWLGRRLRKGEPG